MIINTILKAYFNENMPDGFNKYLDIFEQTTLFLYDEIMQPIIDLDMFKIPIDFSNEPTDCIEAWEE